MQLPVLYSYLLGSVKHCKTRLCSASPPNEQLRNPPLHHPHKQGSAPDTRWNLFSPSTRTMLTPLPMLTSR